MANQRAITLHSNNSQQPFGAGGNRMSLIQETTGAPMLQHVKKSTSQSSNF